MAAEIKAATGSAHLGNVRKPQLINKIEGSSDDINMAVLIPREDGVISVSDDRTLRVWLKRDTGQFWPSICHYMPSAASALDFNPETRRMFIGMDNGTISEYLLAEDYNSMAHQRDYLAHQSKVTAILFALSSEWVLSCGRDKYFQWHCSETGRRLGGYQTNAWCTCLQFDSQSRYAFVGDFSGQISVLKVTSNGVEVITTLKGHSGSVRCLTWDEDRSLLFSGSYDKSIIVWDIGGQQGTAFELQGHHISLKSGQPFKVLLPDFTRKERQHTATELQGHNERVQALVYAHVTKQLVSGAEDSVMAFWDMDVKRNETPEWVESDNCQKCHIPFFWNFKSMWEKKQVGVRQHHCRKCGHAICSKCSEGRSPIPVLGYEYEVRVCDGCHETITDDDKAPMASFHDAKHPIVSMSLDQTRKLLLTVGKDRLMKLWDVSSVLL